jgi:hypothetical protein
VKTLKAKLRAWLIDLVREAIRIERIAARAQEERDMLAKQPDHLAKLRGAMGKAWERRESENYPGKLKTPKSPVAIEASEIERMLEPSFEQMQAESIRAQEEFYEVKK